MGATSASLLEESFDLSKMVTFGAEEYFATVSAIACSD